MIHIKSHVLTVLLVAIFSFSFSLSAFAKNCKKGIPCGNSCISANKTCRIGTSNYSSSSNAYKPKTEKESSNLSNGISENLNPYTSQSSKASSLALVGAAITITTASRGIQYSCTYSKATITDGIVGSMEGFSLSSVEVDGDVFKAKKPNGTIIKSPRMKKKWKFIY